MQDEFGKFYISRAIRGDCREKDIYEIEDCVVRNGLQEYTKEEKENVLSLLERYSWREKYGLVPNKGCNDDKSRTMDMENALAHIDRRLNVFQRQLLKQGEMIAEISTLLNNLVQSVLKAKKEITEE